MATMATIAALAVLGACMWLQRGTSRDAARAEDALRRATESRREAQRHAARAEDALRQSRS